MDNAVSGCVSHKPRVLAQEHVARVRDITAQRVQPRRSTPDVDVRVHKRTRGSRRATLSLPRRAADRVAERPGLAARRPEFLVATAVRSNGGAVARQRIAQEWAASGGDDGLFQSAFFVKETLVGFGLVAGILEGVEHLWRCIDGRFHWSPYCHVTKRIYD